MLIANNSVGLASYTTNVAYKARGIHIMEEDDSYSEELPLYIAIDGDNVGRKLENLIVTNQPKALTIFSERFQSSMLWLRDTLSSEFMAQVILHGGDSLLVSCSKMSFADMQRLQQIFELFSLKTNSTLSAGIGNTLRKSYFALKLAKAKGRNRIEWLEGISDG